MIKKLNQYICREDEIFRRLWAAYLRGEKNSLKSICPQRVFTLNWLVLVNQWWRIMFPIVLALLMWLMTLLTVGHICYVM